jgi:hypothetical protein
MWQRPEWPDLFALIDLKTSGVELSVVPGRPGKAPVQPRPQRPAW